MSPRAPSLNPSSRSSSVEGETTSAPPEDDVPENGLRSPERRVRARQVLELRPVVGDDDSRVLLRNGRVPEAHRRLPLAPQEVPPLGEIDAL